MKKQLEEYLPIHMCCYYDKYAYILLYVLYAYAYIYLCVLYFINDCYMYAYICFSRNKVLFPRYYKYISLIPYAKNFIHILLIFF